jgi:hypothetical protein
MGPKLKEKNKIYLLKKNIKIKRPSNKLNYKKLGLFKINKKVRSINYKLKLSEIIKIYSIFYILLLEPVPPNVLTALVTKVQ